MRYTVSRLAIAAAMAAGLAGPALADVTVTVDVSKTKDVSVVEHLTINKDISVTIEVDVDLNRAAEAIALVNQVIDNNLVDRNVEVTPLLSVDDQQLSRAAVINGPALGADPAGSINDNSGVTGFNQDIGAMTNQGNIWSVALTEDDDTPATPASNDPADVFADAQAEVDQRIGGVERGNTVDLQFESDATPNPGQGFAFAANIEDSINDNTGLTGVNQNAGNMNDQANAVAVGAGLFLGTGTDPDEFDGAAVALAESALGQETAFNTVLEGDLDNDVVSLKLGNMVDSVTGNTGVTQVNQSTANMTNQGNVASVGAAVLAPQL